MYAVILRATVADLNEEYSEALLRMKALAFEQYGCLEFYVMMDGPKRIAISYWKMKMIFFNGEIITNTAKSKKKPNNPGIRLTIFKSLTSNVIIPLRDAYRDTQPFE